MIRYRLGNEGLYWVKRRGNVGYVKERRKHENIYGRDV